MRPPPLRSIERSNLFEALCGLLSKAAFPLSGGLHAVHLQSLDGIRAILASLADGCAGVSDLGAPPAAARCCRARARLAASALRCAAPALGVLAHFACPPALSPLDPAPTTRTDAAHLAPLADPAAYLDIWTPLAHGADPPLEQVRAARAAALLRRCVAAWARRQRRQLLCCGRGAVWLHALANARVWHLAGPGPMQLLGGAGGAPPSSADLARVEKFLKGRLAAAAEHFNRDQKKGFQYLQVGGSLGASAGAARPVTGGGVGGMTATRRRASSACRRGWGMLACCRWAPPVGSQARCRPQQGRAGGVLLRDTSHASGPTPRPTAHAVAQAAARGAGAGRGGALPALLPGPGQGRHRGGAGRARAVL